MLYVFVEIFRLFWLTQKTPEWPKKGKNIKNFRILKFSCKFCQIFGKFRGLDCKKRAEGGNFVIEEAFWKK